MPQRKIDPLPDAAFQLMLDLSAGELPGYAIMREVAEQNGGRMTVVFRDDVHAMMDAIDQINVSVTRRAKHDFGAFGQSFGGMGGQIVFAEIGFNFNNFSDAFGVAGLVNEPFTKQFLRDAGGVAVVKRAW